MLVAVSIYERICFWTLVFYWSVCPSLSQSHYRYSFITCSEYMGRTSLPTLFYRDIFSFLHLFSHKFQNLLIYTKNIILIIKLKINLHIVKFILLIYSTWDFLGIALNLQIQLGRIAVFPVLRFYSINMVDPSIYLDFFIFCQLYLQVCWQRCYTSFIGLIPKFLMMCNTITF